MRSVMHDCIPAWADRPSAPLRSRAILRSGCFYGLLAILIVGGLLRFYGISARGLFIHDEAHSLNVARTYGDSARWLWENRSGGRSISEAREYLLRRGGSLFGSAKEGHVVAQALFSLVYGLRPTTGSVLSGILGTATLLLIFAWGARVYDARTGLLAAAALASSALFLSYGRSGLAQADSIFFAYLGSLLYLLSRERERARLLLLILAGLSLAIAFTCHYNIIYVLVVVLCAELIFPLRRSMRAPVEDHATPIEDHAAPKQPRRVHVPLIIAGAFCGYLILFDIPYEIARMAIGGAYPGFYSYFGELHYAWVKYHAGSAELGAPAARFVFDDPLYFFRLLVTRDGLVATLLLLGSFVFLAVRFRPAWVDRRERRCEDFVALTLFFMPIAVWSFYSFRVERSFIVTLPAGALLVGRALALLIGKARISDGARHATLAAALVLMLLAGFIKAEKTVLIERTNFADASRKALDYAVRTGGIITERSTSWHSAPIWKFYLAYEADHSPDHAAAWRCLNLGSTDLPDILLLDATTRNEAEFASRVAQSRVVANVRATPNLGAIVICDTREEPANSAASK